MQGSERTLTSTLVILNFGNHNQVARIMVHWKQNYAITAFAPLIKSKVPGYALYLCYSFCHVMNSAD